MRHRKTKLLYRIAEAGLANPDGIVCDVVFRTVLLSACRTLGGEADVPMCRCADVLRSGKLDRSLGQPSGYEG